MRARKQLSAPKAPSIPRAHRSATRSTSPTSAPFWATCLLSAMLFASGASAGSTEVASSPGLPAASSVTGTLTIDGTPISMDQLGWRDEGDYVSLTVSDKQVAADLEMAAYAAQGVSGLQLAFVKDPLALDEYLPVMASHPSLDFIFLTGVHLTGTRDTDVYQLHVSMAETEFAESKVALDLEIRVDLGAFEPCGTRTATIEGAESEPAKSFADFYGAIHACNFDAAKALMTKSAVTEWDALSEGRRAAMTTRAPLHVKVVKVETRSDDVAMVYFEAVPSNGLKTGISIQRESGKWKVTTANLF